jgi:hypothetical protein
MAAPSSATLISRKQHVRPIVIIIRDCLPRETQPQEEMDQIIQSYHGNASTYDALELFQQSQVGGGVLLDVHIPDKTTTQGPGSGRILYGTKNSFIEKESPSK